MTSSIHSSLDSNFESSIFILCFFGLIVHEKLTHKCYFGLVVVALHYRPYSQYFEANPGPNFHSVCEELLAVCGARLWNQEALPVGRGGKGYYPMNKTAHCPKNRSLDVMYNVWKDVEEVLYVDLQHQVRCAS